jgi:molybdopterin converting factor small subunit
MLTVSVYYHAILREKLGCATESFQLKEGSVASDIFTEATRRHSSFERLIPILQIALNEEIVSRDAQKIPLKDGDRVDLFPPFGGG